MITYDETLITTNFQVEPIIDLRDMRGRFPQFRNLFMLLSTREKTFLCEQSSANDP